MPSLPKARLDELQAVMRGRKSKSHQRHQGIRYARTVAGSSSLASKNGGHRVPQLSHRTLLVLSGMAASRFSWPSVFLTICSEGRKLWPPANSLWHPPLRCRRLPPTANVKSVHWPHIEKSAKFRLLQHQCGTGAALHECRRGSITIPIPVSRQKPQGDLRLDPERLGTVQCSEPVPAE